MVKTTLLVDALYYAAANDSLHAARDAVPGIDAAKEKVEEKQGEWDALETSNLDDVAKGNRQERVAIELESLEWDLGAAYSPLLRRVAAVQLFSAACLEAHINRQAKERLGGNRALDHFDQLSLEGKWFLFPGLLKIEPFDPGCEPFQGFTKLIKYRNALSHFKGKSEEWKAPGVPTFLSELGLSLDAASKSVETVYELIELLSTRFGEDKPHWLDDYDVNHFD
jgi:hypothetical protein